MGRVSQAQAAENRERVVATASRLFRTHGAENVSIADVMAEAGLTVGAFYKQFESKDALVSEAFARAFDDASGVWSSVTANAESATDALVEHYLSPRPARYTCPILAFAAPASHAASAAEPRTTYAQGVESLYAQFCQAAEVNDDETSATKDPRVTFAAMIGAALLEKSVGSTDWVSEIRSAVLERS
ncbi:MAG: TetR/AcrR family transcriptional regulator [Micrococcaceae bacterium]